jgi:hypothetical protein
MNQPNNQYKQYVTQFNNEEHQRQMLHTVYLSRRAIWVNVLLSFLLSFLAAYIHTRRWKSMGIFSLSMFIFLLAIGGENDSFAESFAQGQSLAPLFSLIATVDNSLAIDKARKKVDGLQVEN